MKRQNSADWTPKQVRAAVLLATGKSVRDVAGEIGAGERTIFSWMADEGFRTLVGENRDRMLSEALGRLSEGASEAADTLRALLSDSASNVRLRAAVALLDSLLKVREYGDMAERLAELERRVAESGTKWEPPQL